MPDPDPPVVLELRVHGVRGTPPSSMLGIDAGNVVQVAGDDLTGFYRPADGTELRLRTPKAELAVEVYSWGALTSGVRGWFGWVQRVLWLALLPFALVNMAFWARQHAGEQSGQARWGLRAVRVSGVLLTVVAVLTPCVVAIDLVGWQCFRSNSIACPVLPDWTDRLASLSTGQRMALTSLVPLAAILGLVLLSFRTLARYEATPMMTKPGGTSRGADVGILGDSKMWKSGGRTRRLQRLHVAAALATVVCFTGIHLLVVARLARLWPTTVAGVLILVLVVALATTVDPRDHEHATTRRHFWSRSGTRWYDALAWVALVVVVAHLAVLWTIRLPLALHDRNFTGTNTWFITLFAALTVLHVVLFVGGRLPGPLATLVAGLFLALVVSGVVLGHGGAGVRNAVLLALGALMAWLVLALIQVRLARRGRWGDEDGPDLRAMAWVGAGSSLLLGAATMVALLFTTAAVVATANHLNGPDQSVDDLVTRRHEVAPVNAPTLRAAGDVVLAGARITSDGGTIRVSSGTIVVDTLTATDPDSRLATIGLGSTHLRKSVVVLPPDATGVRLESSCYGRAGDPDYASKAPCTGESVGFRTAGTLLVPPACQVDGVARRCLLVKAASDRISIDVAESPQGPLVVPQVLVWTPLMQFALLVLGTIALLLAIARFRLTAARRIRKEAMADTRIPTSDRATVAATRVRAALAHRAERVLDVLGMVTSILALPTLALSLNGRPPWDVVEWSRPFATISLYTVVVVSLGLMFAGAQIRKSPEARRSVGILWDITTFWPRAAHPFAPPCYAERVVPEVTARLRWALERDPQGIVVLSGHSQGSLICAAVLCQLNGLAHRVRLVTYGSQIRTIYGRVFPRAAGPQEFGYTATTGAPLMGTAAPDLPTEPAGPTTSVAGLRARLARPEHWVNLFRRGDPLGYRVFSDLDDPALDRPTLEVPTIEWGDPGPRVLGHGGYQHTQEYREVVAAWTGEPVVGPPATTADVRPLPGP